MTEYYEDELNDPEQEIIRPKDVRKHSAFAYCKWAAKDWEAQYYAWTDTQQRECDRSVDNMVNNPAWFKTRPPKIDKRVAVSNNRAKGSRKPRKRKKETS